MLAYMLQNLEAIGCLGAQRSSLTTPLSATQQGDRYHVLTGTENERGMEFLRQRVSIEIQRGNAASVMGTVDNPKEWNNLFLLS